MIQRLKLNQTNRPLEVVMHWDASGILELSPPYQRGDVWGVKRQRNLIYSILMGVPIPSIIINDRFAAEWSQSEQIAVIDGKQRITAVLAFLNNKLPVPVQWFGFEGDLAAMVHYSDLPIARQRGISHQPIAFSEGCLASLDAEREDATPGYVLGKVWQAEKDLAAVREYFMPPIKWTQAEADLSAYCHRIMRNDDSVIGCLLYQLINLGRGMPAWQLFVHHVAERVTPTTSPAGCRSAVQTAEASLHDYRVKGKPDDAIMSRTISAWLEHHEHKVRDFFVP